MSSGVSMYHAVDNQLIRPGRSQESATLERPTGPGYVRWEDIYVTGDTMQQTFNRVPLDANGQKQIVTFPEGLFEYNGFNEGYYEGFRIGGPDGHAGGVKGIWGSGRNTIFRPKANTANRQLPGNIAGDQFGFNRVDNAVLKNFALHGTPQNGLYYTGIKMYMSHNLEIDNLYLRGASPGYSNYPPGETFGLNIFQCTDALVQNCEIDGRDANGNRSSSSPLGWNGTGAPGAAGNLSKNATVKNVYAHHSIAGMLTFWQTLNVYTEDYYSYSNGSGSGSLSGAGINHEESNGVIRHIRPKLYLTGYKSTEPGHTQNNSSHMTMQNTTADMTDVQVIEPEFDTSHSPTGMFCVSQYEHYTNKTTGATDKVESRPKIIYKGVQLQAKDHPAKGWGDWPRDQYFAVIH